MRLGLLWGRFLLFVSLAATVFGCADEAPSPSDNGLRVLLSGAPQELDPRFVGDATGLRVSRLIFASLVTIDPETLEVVPDLAEDVRVVDDVTYEVRLRPSLRFSDGAPLTAKDVKATFDGVVSEALQSRYRSSYLRIARIEVRDARTIRFVLSAPHATFLTDLELPIVRASDGTRRMTMAPADLIGAGPYVLTRLDGHHIALLPNTHWHGGPAGGVKAGDPPLPLALQIVQDDNTRALRLLSGKADLAIGTISPLLVPMFEKDARFDVRSKPGVGTNYLGLRTDVAPLDDARVRAALAHAIDRGALLRAKFHGRATSARGWIPPGHWAYAEVRAYAYDPAQARRLLDDAGYAPERRLLLRTSADRFRISIARAVAAMLGEVGVPVDVRPSETGTLLADLGKGRFDLTFLGVPEVFEPHVLSWFFSSERIPSPGHPGSNRWRFRNARFDELLEEGRRTIGIERRRPIYREVQRIMADALPVVPLWHEHVVVVSRRGIDVAVPRDGRLSVLAWARRR